MVWVSYSRSRKSCRSRKYCLSVSPLSSLLHGAGILGNMRLTPSAAVAGPGGPSVDYSALIFESIHDAPLGLRRGFLRDRFGVGGDTFSVTARSLSTPDSDRRRNRSRVRTASRKAFVSTQSVIVQSRLRAMTATHHSIPSSTKPIVSKRVTTYIRPETRRRVMDAAQVKQVKAPTRMP